MLCKYKSIPLEKLKQLVLESITIAEVMRKLGYTANRGNSFKGLKEHLNKNNIDISHFKGNRHGSSKTEKYSLEQILIKNNINGDNRDNRLENLRLLCPNCHSQTETFCGKNRGNSAGGQFAPV